MQTEAPILADYEEANYSRTPLGPSSRSCCKVTVGNVCGSGSIVGSRNGKSLVLTNAHVAGTTVGKRVNCQFPFLENRVVGARIIMAAYSDRIMMDWAVLELDSLVDLPIVKLSREGVAGEHYTGGYPRCQGPFFQKLITRSFSHGGTVWRWQPNSIGGQSGSGVHSFKDHLQKGLLTWSWGGDGAGQTTKSIWMQYSKQAAVGYERPEGLVELCERAEDVENGFFSETNITTLPIWAELDEGDDDGDGGIDPDDPKNPEIVKAFLESAERLKKESEFLIERAKRFGAKPDKDGGGFVGGGGSGTFGL